MPMTTVSRRSSLALLALAPFAVPALAQPLPRVAVTKDPNCGCCGGWVDHMRGAGFTVEVIEAANLNPLKSRLGVPNALWSCHTAEVGPYVLEGHVPAHAVRRLLTEKPAARGLAVPGMPVGSPGMEIEGSPNEPYDVVLFGPAQQRSFGRYKAAEPI
jgi:hypothetical protein